MLSRRSFLQSSAFALAVPTLLRAGEDLPSDIRITRIVAFNLITKRNKLAGKNARLDVHGDTGHDRCVRLFTNTSHEGVGVCWADKKEDLAPLLGKPLRDYFDLDQPKMRGDLRASWSMPFYDLAGKILNKPVCELLGAPPSSEPRKIPIYDGSIYFADLLPQYADKWQDEFKRELDLGMSIGHRGFKCKMGRGNKWMPRAEGDARDVEVVKLIRGHVGKDVLIGIDANNGYDLAGAKRFVEQTADCKLAFTEEMFPEEVEQCRALKEYFKELKLDTLLADGETQHDLAVYEPFIKSQTIDILQGDMNHYGLEGIRTEAAMAAPQGIRIAPHNWGSYMGYFQEMHVAPSITNWYRGEHDPLTSDYLLADGYKIADGFASYPGAPGFGLRVDEERFARDAKIRFELK